MKSVVILGFIVNTGLAFAAAPSGTNLDAAVKDYEKTSIDLEKTNKDVHDNVTVCGFMGVPGGMMASQMGPKMATEAPQRKRILDALHAAQVKMDAQTKSIGSAVGGQASAGQVAVAAAKKIIVAGVDEPTKAIDQELPQVKATIDEMNANVAKVRSYVFGGATGQCKTAFTAFEKSRVLLLSKPDKLNKIKAALAERQKNLLSWAAEIEKALVQGSGSVASSGGK